MSILIKGMEMPKNCEKCNLCDVVYCNSYRFCSLDFYRETRAPDCPLIEVPTPHGDLIDRDAIQYANNTTFDEDYVRRKTIMKMPTIIEAED